MALAAAAAVATIVDIVLILDIILIGGDSCRYNCGGICPGVVGW